MSEGYLRVPGHMMTAIRAQINFIQEELSILDEMLTEAGFFCCDCEIDTCGSNYYMVNNDLWKKHGVGEGMLCIPCLEKRLQRKLTANDFSIEIPINRANEYMCGIMGVEPINCFEDEDEDA